MVAIASPAAAAKARAPRAPVQRLELETVLVAKKRRQQKRGRAGGTVEASETAETRCRVADDEQDTPQFGRLRLHGPRKIVVSDDDRRRSLGPG